MTKATGILAALATAAAAWSGALADTAEDLRQAEQTWLELWTARDAAGLAQLYAEDGIRLPPDASRIQGREAIEDMFEAEFEAGLENLQLEPTDIGHDGDLGWVVGNLSIDFPMGDSMGTGTGNYVIVYRKEDDGAWRIVIDTWNDAP